VDRFSVLQQYEYITRPEDRLDLFLSALEAMITYPIHGLGIGGFAQWFYGVEQRGYPHNILLETGAELGLPGLVLIAYLFWSPLRMFLASLHKPIVRVVQEVELIRITVFGFISFIWITTLSSGNLNDNRIVFTALALLTVICRQQEDTDDCY